MPELPRLAKIALTKVRETLLLNVVIAFVLLGGLYLTHQVRHRRNRTRWDALYSDARKAYNRAAALRDADASQFDPEYAEAKLAINAQEGFVMQKTFDSEYGRAAFAASDNLRLCLDGLQVYRLTTTSPQAFRLHLEQMIDNCIADGRTGEPSEMK
jgi:hypothetical protein